MRVFAGNRKDRMFNNKDFTDLLYAIAKIWKIENKCNTLNFLGKIIPTNKLFEKSGEGNIKKPPINPIKIEIYAVFSLMFLL